MREWIVTVLVVVVLLPALGIASADVPTVISYQGKLMESSGIPVADGTCQMTFAIYDAETGGTQLWTEMNPSVQVKGGLFSVLLGSVTPFTPDLFDGADRWFGVSIGGAAELSPRQRIASAAFAQVARTVVDGSITVTKLAPGAVTADKLAAEARIPVGVIVMWSGSTPPAGWALCDGQNGTPNLRDKFVVAAGSAYPLGSQGGGTNMVLSLTHSHVVNDHVHNANHSHGMDAAGDHAHHMDFVSSNAEMWYGMGLRYIYNDPVQCIGHKHYIVGDTWGGGSHTHGIQGNNFNTGVASNRGTDPQLTSPIDVRPPYYALAFIMKL